MYLKQVFLWDIKTEFLILVLTLLIYGTEAHRKTLLKVYEMFLQKKFSLHI